jgi:hypothetical protein
MISIIVDIILEPFLWLSARRLRKSDEWRDNQAKIKELTKKAEMLGAKADQAQEYYQQMMYEKKLLRDDSKYKNVSVYTRK